MASPETSPYNNIYLAPYLVLPFDVKDLSAACTEAYRSPQTAAYPTKKNT
jgi:hypothetical protein